MTRIVFVPSILAGQIPAPSDRYAERMRSGCGDDLEVSSHESKTVVGQVKRW